MLIPAVLQVRGTAAFLAAALVVVGAEIVLVTILLPLLEQYRPGWMLAGEALGT